MPTPTLLTSEDTPKLQQLREHCRKRHQRLKEKRQLWLMHCRQIAEQLLPNRLPCIDDPQALVRGGAQNENIVDAVGHLSLNTAAGGVHGGTMPQTGIWFGLKVRNIFQEDDSLRYYLDTSRATLLDLHNGANTNQVMPELQKEWLAFGVAAALKHDDEEAEVGFRLDPLTIGEYCIEDDARGRVDTIYREFTMTLAQLVDEFGVERLSQDLQQRVKEGDKWDDVIKCVHAIEPDRDGQNPIPSPEQPWRSVYYEDSKEAQGVLDVRGYTSFPALVWRYTKLPQSAYAIGLGADALPHILRLTRLIYRYGQALAFKAEPPVQIPAGMSTHEVKYLPGGKSTYYGQQEIKALMKVELELREVAEQIEQARQDVRDTLGATLVASLRRITQTMTKAEAEIRKSEDLTEFLAGLARLQSEMLGPYIEMLWEMAEERGMLPRLPRQLQNKVIDIEFTSPLARKQRQSEADAIVRTWAVAAEMAKVNREVLDNLDPDESIRRVAEIEGTPARVMVPLATVNETRAARRNQALAEKQALAVQHGVELAKGVAETERLEAA